MNTDPSEMMVRINVSLRNRHIVALDRACLDAKEKGGVNIGRNELLAAVLEVADLEGAARKIVRERK